MYTASPSVPIRDKGDAVGLAGEEHGAETRGANSLLPSASRLASTMTFPRRAHPGAGSNGPRAREMCARRLVWSFLPFFSGYYFTISGGKQKVISKLCPPLSWFSLGHRSGLP